jgi:hypothetical protein
MTSFSRLISISFLGSLVLLTGCNWKFWEEKTPPAASPLYYSDYADPAFLTEDEVTNDNDPNVVRKELIKPTVVISWQAKDDVLGRLQNILNPKALEQLTTTYNQLSSTAKGQIMSQAGSLYWFPTNTLSFNPQDLEKSGTWVLQTTAPVTQADMTSAIPTTQVYLSKKDQFTLISPNVNFLENVSSNLTILQDYSSRSQQTLSIDFYPSVEIVDQLSRQLLTQSTTKEQNTLIQLFISALSNTERISLYGAINPSTQELLFSVKIKAQKDTLLENLFSDLVVTPGPEGTWLSPRNAVEMQLGAYNNAAIFKYLAAQPEANQDLLRLSLAWLKVTKGNYVAGTYQDNRGTTYTSGVFGLNANMQPSFIRLLEQSNKFLNDLFKRQSILQSEGTFSGPDSRGIYGYSFPTFTVGQPASQMHFGLIREEVVFTTNRAMLEPLIQAVTSQTVLNPNLLSIARINPYTANYSLMYVPLPMPLPDLQATSIPISSSIESSKSGLELSISLSKDWVSYMTSVFSKIASAQAQQASAPAQNTTP